MAWTLTEVRQKSFFPLLVALGVSHLTSLFLFAVRVIGTGTFEYSFILWNLFLGAMPLLFVVVLLNRLAKAGWLDWKNIVLVILWLGFLPNSFYILTDYIHLGSFDTVDTLFDIVWFSSCVLNAYILGYMSLYLVHQELLMRKIRYAHAMIAGVLLACSFAIYLGRFLRWNTWDVLINPAGVIFDVSDRFINPGSHPQAFLTTVTFFVLLSSVYLVIYNLVLYIKPPKKRRLTKR